MLCIKWCSVTICDTHLQVTTTSEGGRGVLTIRNARAEDEGAYTCEALNNKGSIFAVPDAIITITGTSQYHSHRYKQPPSPLTSAGQSPCHNSVSAAGSSRERLVLSEVAALLWPLQPSVPQITGTSTVSSKRPAPPQVPLDLTGHVL